MSEVYDTPRGFDDYDYCPRHDLVLNMGTLCPKCITPICGHCGKRITGSIQKCSNDSICTMRGPLFPFIDRECVKCGFQWYENYATEQCPSCENRKLASDEITTKTKVCSCSCHLFGHNECIACGLRHDLKIPSQYRVVSDAEIAAEIDEIKPILITPKPTPDPKVEQVAKRPHRIGGEPFARFYAIQDADALFDFQDAKIAELEKELRVMRRAAELYDVDEDAGTFRFSHYIEAARKETT